MSRQGPLRPDPTTISACGALLAIAAACAPAAAPAPNPTRATTAPAVEPVIVETRPPQRTLAARDLAQRSAGDERGSSWIMLESGYAGSYLEVLRAGRVQIGVRAQGHHDLDAAPRLGIAVAGASKHFDVDRAAKNYHLELDLPEGVHFVRFEYRNGSAGSRQLTLHEVSVDGGRWLASNTDEHALAAANTYIEHYRRGEAKLTLSGVSPGSQVRVKLVRHAFNFGTNIPYSTNQLIPATAPLPEKARRFQEMVLGRFNTVVLSNGGKWVYHEPVRDRVDLAYVDRFLDFAEQHALTARMHTMLWDTEQQPSWVVSTERGKDGLLTQAVRGDEQAKKQLSEEIDERIEAYVKERAKRYTELDVLNESLHKARYVQAYGEKGVAEIFDKTQRAVKAAGADTRLYLNEYNLLQWSNDPQSGRRDPYANWYRAHAEAILRAGGPIDGLGIQYYADARGPEQLASNAHSPARIMQVLQNLSSTGLRLSLTEFAVNPGRGTPEQAAQVLEDSMRLIFGTPAADSFMIWAIWADAAIPPPVSVLFDKAGKRTVVGERFDRVMATWSTDVRVAVAERGVVELQGFYGDYEVTQAGKVAGFTLSPDALAHSLELTTR